MPTKKQPTPKYEPNSNYRIKLSQVVEVPGVRLKPADDNVVAGWICEDIDWAITSSEKVG